MMSEPILIACLAGQRIAFPARRLESIVELDRIVHVPRSPDHIEGLATLRSQSLTVINCAKVLGISEQPRVAEAKHEAAIVKHGDHQYALLLDAVEDVVEWDGTLDDVLGGLGNAWKRVAVGVVQTDNGPALLLDVERLIEFQPATAQ